MLLKATPFACVVLCLQGGCAEPKPTVVVAPPDASPGAPQAKTLAEPDREPPGAVADPEPIPGVPQGPVAPDGTAIEPCTGVPAAMACVAGGPFIRGSDDGPKNTHPAADVWLQTYYMDLYEVTYADYKACQKRKDCPRGGPLYNDFSRAKQPIVGPSWYGAVKYCEVQGKHLPTEAQWEKAARGPDGKLHPWGDEPATCERAVIKDKRGRSCGVKKRREFPDKGRTFVIGSRPPGIYGLYDMSGNAWEWVNDWASPSYEACGDACLGTDPRGPCDGAEECAGHTERVVRGGSWYWVARYATGIHRRFHVPGNDPFHHFGFRCAASLAEARALVEAAATALPISLEGSPSATPRSRTD